MFKHIKRYGRVINAAFGFLYDFKRFVLYAAWKENMQDKDIRNYHMVKVYHSLEKSLSFKKRDERSGWATANMLLDMIKVANRQREIGCHDKAALDVLIEFIDHPSNTSQPQAKKIRGEINEIKYSSGSGHGIIRYKDEDLFQGKLKDPEKFFLSRYSLREFKDEKVDYQLLLRAVSMAMKTPSVCNRQAWHIYHTNDNSIIRSALSYQQGNKGFGERVPNLIVISTDLKAFMPGQEHYQHWIDGGLFAMSIIYAFHSLGIASCCLNWSQSPANDLKLRSAFNIRSNDTVIMMLAFGYPEKENNVCVSARRPKEEIISSLKLRGEE